MPFKNKRGFFALALTQRDNETIPETISRLSAAEWIIPESDVVNVKRGNMSYLYLKQDIEAMKPQSFKVGPSTEEYGKAHMKMAVDKANVKEAKEDAKEIANFDEDEVEDQRERSDREQGPERPRPRRNFNRPYNRDSYGKPRGDRRDFRKPKPPEEMDSEELVKATDIKPKHKVTIEQE